MTGEPWAGAAQGLPLHRASGDLELDGGPAMPSAGTSARTVISTPGRTVDQHPPRTDVAGEPGRHRAGDLPSSQYPAGDVASLVASCPPASSPLCPHAGAPLPRLAGEHAVYVEPAGMVRVNGSGDGILPTGGGKPVQVYGPGSVGDKLTDDKDVGLEGDTSEAIEHPPDDTLTAPEPDQVDELPLDHTNAPDRVKAARRRWAGKVTEMAPMVTLPSRLLILRITLAFWSANNWEEEASEPERLVAHLLASLDTDNTPTELAERVGTLAAVAITMLRERVDLTVRDDRLLRYQKSSAAVAHLLSAANEGLIDECVRGLRNRYEGTLTREAVLEVIANLTGNDALADLNESLENAGHEVTRPAPHLVQVRGTFSNPVQAALDAVGAAGETTRIGLWALNENGDWALVVWNKPDLVTVSRQGGRKRWRHQQLTGLVSPAAIATMTRRAGPATQFDIVARPKHAPTAAARDVLAAVGIQEPEPPA